jgi:diguanylate cyclase (GGDEF)-like protein
VFLDDRHPRAALSLYPIAAIVVVAWLWILVDPVQLPLYAVSVGLLVVSGVVEIVRLRRGWRGLTASLAAGLAFLAAVGFLRQAGGGFTSAVSILALVPVFRSALFARRQRELWVILGAVAALYLAPILLIGAPDYPHTQYRAGILTVGVSWVIGLATRRLVARARSEADDARRSRTVLEQVTRLAHELLASGDVRADLCSGALRIADASVAVLFEHNAGALALHCSASAGVAASSGEVPRELDVPLDRSNPVGLAFLGGASVRSAPGTAGQAALPELWECCGRPDSILYQPLARGGEPIGVLVVAWDSGGAEERARATVIELLAHEAALVLDRVDQVTLLAGMAETDPLTGLPNRRAWDERLAHAARTGEKLTVAMLDLDCFKLFNDANGHQAGDRLLRETAAAWLEHVRGGDLLARLGGEEFGLLLLDCNSLAALEITERLRATVTDGQTCSAGIAVPRPGEPFHSVLERADRALYEAKEAGRDLARAAS